MLHTEWLNVFASSERSLYRLALALTADPQLTEKCLAEALCRATREQASDTVPRQTTLKRIVVECALKAVIKGAGSERATADTTRKTVDDDWALEAIKAIEPALRVPFVLAACEHLPLPEVARLLGWDPSRVKVAVGDAAVELTRYVRRLASAYLLPGGLLPCSGLLEQSACAG